MVRETVFRVIKPEFQLRELLCELDIWCLLRGNNGKSNVDVVEFPFDFQDLFSQIGNRLPYLSFLSFSWPFIPCKQRFDQRVLATRQLL
jgi:hypothetical protein